MGALDDLLQARNLIARHVNGADPDRVRGADAARLVTLFAELERLVTAGKVLYADKAAASTVWRDEGHRSPASWVAQTTGCGLGEAISTLESSAALPSLPATAEALRNGELSAPQLKVITDVAPTRACDENALIEAAATSTLKGLKQKGAEIKAAATSEEEEAARYRGLREKRSVRHWSDPDGMFRLAARLTPDAGAQVLSALSAEADARFRQARKAQEHEAPAAYLADALLALVTGAPLAGQAQDPAKAKARGPGATVVYRVDAAAFRRGHVKAGETCVIAGVGPVPVAAVRRQLSDAFLKILVKDGVDVTTVCHVGRTVPAHLQSALEERDPVCVVPGCDTGQGLENHHWKEPYAECGTSTLAGLARVCAWHHDLLTYDDYVLEGGPGKWEMRAPPDGGRFDTS